MKWKCIVASDVENIKPGHGTMVTVFANGLGDWGSIPGWVISKTQKMVFDVS